MDSSSCRLLSLGNKKGEWRAAAAAAVAVGGGGPKPSSQSLATPLLTTTTNKQTLGLRIGEQEKKKHVTLVVETKI